MNRTSITSHEARSLDPEGSKQHRQSTEKTITNKTKIKSAQYRFSSHNIDNAQISLRVAVIVALTLVSVAKMESTDRPRLDWALGKSVSA